MSSIMAAELCASNHAASRPGCPSSASARTALDGLGAAARRLVSAAEFVFGGKRHLALAARLIKGERRPWPSPFDAADADPRRSRPPRLRARLGRPVLHGVGATLARLVAPAEMAVFPAPSAFSLAAARLGWPLPEIARCRCTARPVELLRPHLHPGRRVLALTSDADGPAALAALLGGDAASALPG